SPESSPLPRRLRPWRAGTARRPRGGHRESAGKVASSSRRQLNAAERASVRFRGSLAVGEEPVAARPPEASGLDEPAEHRSRSVALLAVLIAQGLEHPQHMVHSDRVGPGKWAAGVTEPEEHPGVDVARFADAFAQRERRLVYDLAD